MTSSAGMPYCRAATFEMIGVFRRAADFANFVKFEHSIFALPFALSSMLFAFDGEVVWSTVGWIVVCMVSARSSAMAFNRIYDLDLDKVNPRTMNRELIVGKISLAQAWAFFAVMVLLFLFAASRLNMTCLYLAPAALLIIISYTFTKRFSWLCHAHLGLSLAIAPVGAWIGVRESFSWPVAALAAAVLFWVTSFDIIYTFPDIEFEKKYGVYSIPTNFGVKAAMRIVAVFHLLTVGLLALFGYMMEVGTAYYVAIGAICIALSAQHLLCRGLDMKKVNIAFFHMNALVSLLLLVASTLEHFRKNG